MVICSFYMCHGYGDDLVTRKAITMMGQYLKGYDKPCDKPQSKWLSTITK
jgi:hypothetical protein